MNKPPLQGVVLNITIKRGYGLVAAGVAGVVQADARAPLEVKLTERDLGVNRKARRVIKANARSGTRGAKLAAMANEPKGAEPKHGVEHVKKQEADLRNEHDAPGQKDSGVSKPPQNTTNPKRDKPLELPKK
jgi:hypothetical protein